MRETRSWKLTVREGVENAQEEFDSAFTQLEKRIKKLENDNDDLEQYGRRVCLRIEDVPVANEETAEEVFKKVFKGSSNRARLYVL